MKHRNKTRYRRFRQRRYHLASGRKGMMLFEDEWQVWRVWAPDDWRLMHTSH